ncbi:DUF3310 domain-containing protein, partial [Vibrio cidicii]
KERLRGDRCGYEIPKTGSVEDVTKRLIASQILSKQVFDDSVSTANEAVKKVDVNHPDYEHVNHPTHYNSHPSGIEIIDLVELMPFNTGNAVKYVARRGEKGKAAQDLDKAIWYTSRERDRIKLMLESYPSRVLDTMNSNVEFSEQDFARAHKFLTMETVPIVSDFYSLVFEGCTIREYYENLEDALVCLRQLKETL